MPAEDFEILSGIQQSDEKSFDLLFDIYYEKLCNYSASIIHDFDVAEDIIQDLFAKLWVDRKHIKIKSSFKSYLFRSAYNACLDYLKHLKVRGNYQSLNTNQSSSFNDSLEYVELLEKLETGINQLPEQCRAIFKLSRFENLKYKEIAKKLNISENTVDTQIRRALKKLKEGLTDYLIFLTIVFIQLF